LPEVLGIGLVIQGLRVTNTSAENANNAAGSGRGARIMVERLLEVQHCCNPLHVHCRLVERGLNKGFSLSICKCYGVLIYSWLAWISVFGIQVCRLVK
jgi:hypothetical protein